MTKRKSFAVPTSERLNDLMSFVAFTNKFRAIERTVWFKGVSGKEPDGEHSFQVAMCAWYLNERLSLGLDLQRLIEYGLVHDIVETYARDTPAFKESGCGRVPSHRTKEKRERKALARIASEWSAFPGLVARMRAYKHQKDEESKFIYALDKLVSAVNIYQDGGRSFRILGVTLKMYDRYKTPRTKKHRIIKSLWEEMLSLLKLHEHKLFPPIISP
ncbi:hypothetical protein A3E65_02465 [Candidatus Kaiserbacteria bacterium RIFCSPHIGHO2_12_FULL_56_13]|uniref:5'-deoxynucleotidase n=1 Tax=Candidatus Kaiserbacteria bacterium RIFCSPHIGHO2_12_FULL_56_13 TaxID=1798505 RepID=A0A1F6EEJ7_9BACT|nr:MAG: hypothetical protein A3E65_02465 [Candidatus Kaiserbacteria bacterium RIFCSPHIGHO2_12_FULL_56_13]